MLRRLYDWILARAGDKRAIVWLWLLSFLDGAFLPIPPDLLQIPMTIARPARWLRIVLVGASGAAAGALAGYAIGALLYLSVGVPLLTAFGRLAEFEHFKAAVAHDPWLWLLGFAFYPSVTAMAAGSIPLGIAGCIAGSVVGRGGRFLIVGLLLKRFGPAAQRAIDRHFHSIVLGAGALILVLIGVRYATA